MTEEQYRLLVQYADDFRCAMCAYEDEYGFVDLKNDPISEIVQAGANLMHSVYSLEPIRSTQGEDPF